MRKILRISVSAVWFLVFMVISPVQTYALTESQREMYSQNNIMFYDPNGMACNDFTMGAFTGGKTEGLSDLQAAFVDTYHDIAASLSIEYGIPWETVVAQGILESTSGTSAFARERNNFFGIGAYDSDPDKARRFESVEAGWRGYYENIKNTPTYRNHGVFSGEAITNPYVYAQVIKSAGYATDVNYVAKLAKLIGGIEKRAGEKGWQSSAALANAYPEMLENAAEILADSGTSSSSSSKKSIFVCSMTGASGNLVAGGMTLQEAKSFMEPYRAIRPRNYHEPGGNILSRWKINNTGCNSDLENCVAYVQYFICEYANVCMGLPDGRNVVSRLLSIGKGFIDGGTTPRPYAVFSTVRPTKYVPSANHTGVVLGIDTARNKIIIGEAGCYGGLNYTNAKEHDLSEYTNGGYRYAYTDGLIRF